ncbi:MAG: hypothetical protein V4724_26575 [Pseudomonadota bacterium]
MSGSYAYGGDPTGLAGAYHYGGGGLGVLGSLIPSSGANGAGYLFKTLSLPADAGKEYCGLITSIPAGLTITAEEDSDFAASGADGTYIVPFDVIENGINIGSSSFTLTFGSGVTAPGVTFTATSGIVPGAASGGTGSAAPGAVLTATGSLTPGAATGNLAATAPGATLTGASTIHAGHASGPVYISAYTRYTVAPENRTYTIPP